MPPAKKAKACPGNYQEPRLEGTHKPELDFSNPNMNLLKITMYIETNLSIKEQCFQFYC